MGPIARALGSGIGLAREAYAARKFPNTTPGSSSVTPAPITSSTLAPPGYVEGEDDPSDSEDEKLQEDGAIWELDEAQPPAYTREPPTHDGVDQLAQNFHMQHPLLPDTRPQGRLQDPVILPQRRPENRSRGFVRAYAPSLNDCGIDQQTFMDFLDSFDKSIEASPYLRVASVGFSVVGAVPSLTTMIVSIVGQQAVKVGQEIEGRHKTNDFLDQINESLFKPRGLFAVVMSFQPTQQAAPSRLSISNDLVDISRMAPKLKASHGVTNGDIALPSAAPLIFPSLDSLAEGEKQSWMQRSNAFVTDYFDRRAQATFAAQNPNSGSLNAALPRPAFASRYSDPTHAASSGSLVALVTGGAVNPRARRQARRGREGRLGQRRSRREDRRRLGSKNPRGVVRKFVQQDVMYLLVTNLPSDNEVAAAMAARRSTSAQQAATTSSSTPPQQTDGGGQTWPGCG